MKGDWVFTARRNIDKRQMQGMNWLPFNVLHNCQQNRRMRDGWASTLSLPLRFQREQIITLRHLSFCRFCDVFKLVPRPQQRAWVSVVRLCVSQNQAAPFPFFLVLIWALLSISSVSKTATKDTEKSICHVPNSTMHYGWLAEPLQKQQLL